MDLGLVERLKRDTEARAAAVAAAVRSDNLRTALLADRLRRMVWDSMMVKGAVVSGLRSATVVHNFPLAQPGSSERVLRQVRRARGDVGKSLYVLLWIFENVFRVSGLSRCVDVP